MEREFGYNPYDAEDYPECARLWELLRRNADFKKLAALFFTDPSFRLGHREREAYIDCALRWMIPPKFRRTRLGKWKRYEGPSLSKTETVKFVSMTCNTPWNKTHSKFRLEFFHAFQLKSKPVLIDLNYAVPPRIAKKMEQEARRDALEWKRNQRLSKPVPPNPNPSTFPPLTAEQIRTLSDGQMDAKSSAYRQEFFKRVQDEKKATGKSEAGDAWEKYFYQKNAHDNALKSLNAEAERYLSNQLRSKTEIFQYARRSLDQIDFLVFGVPRFPYTEKEMDAVLDWIRAEFRTNFPVSPQYKLSFLGSPDEWQAYLLYEKHGSARAGIQEWNQITGRQEAHVDDLWDSYGHTFRGHIRRIQEWIESVYPKFKILPPARRRSRMKS